MQQKSRNTLSYDSIEVPKCLARMGNQKDIEISLMTMRTTTNTAENQKKRKVLEESVEAI